MLFPQVTSTEEAKEGRPTVTYYYVRRAGARWHSIYIA